MHGGLQCRGLAVGINDYRDGIAPLHSAARDARAVADLLSQQHGYQLSCLLDAEASSSAILVALEDAASSFNEEHAFLLFFAGHGVAFGEGDEGPQGYLLAQDARATDDSSWLPMTALRAALEKLPCRHVLVILDCCFAGSFRWSSSRDAVLLGQPLYDSQLDRYLQGEAWQALTSAAHDQRAADTLPGRRNTRDSDDAAEHSPFAAALLRGLGGAADSARGGHAADGVITATELYQFLFEELMPAGTDGRQTPGLWPLRRDNSGEFIFRAPGAALNTRPDPPLDDRNNPWVGLRAYAAADAGLFFGRRRVVEALLERALDPAAASLLVVVGASGTGKSSVVKAGLLPTLAERGWLIHQAPRLRSQPSAQLAEALRALPAGAEGQRRLLLLDQFEELYTQCADSGLRTAFLASLRAIVEQPGGPLVVLTLRSDFEPRLAGCAQFGGLLAKARYLVPSFSNEELREVVEAPLQAKALYFDPPDLLDRLLDEVTAMPGALPLLSFALAEMYRCAQLRRRQTGALDRALSASDYSAIGGVVGALHQRASALYTQSDAGHRRCVERVFLRMVSQEGARLARRRVSRLELEYPDPADQARVERVLADYVEARLLVVDGDYIEPAHDSLVSAWEHLQDWLSSSKTHWLTRALWRAARDWDSDARKPGLLWDSDPRLPQAVAMPAELNRLEQDFVQASGRRRKRRRRLLAGTSLAIMAVLAFAALYSFERAEEAIRQTEIAEQQLAEARYASGRALLAQSRQNLERGDYFNAALNAGEALGFRHYGVEPNAVDAVDDATLPLQLIEPQRPEYAQAMLELSRATLATLLPVAWNELGHARVAGERAILAGFISANQVELRDFTSGRKHLLPSFEGRALGLEFSADGRWLAAKLGADGARARVALWRPAGDWGSASLEILALPQQASAGDDIVALRFAPGGDALAAALSDGIAFWDLSARARPSPRWLAMAATAGVDRRSSLGFSPDGKSLLSGGWHNRLSLYPRPSAGAGPEPLNLRGRALGPEWTLWSENVQKGDFVNAIEYTPQGEHLIIASAHQILIGAVENEGVAFDDGAVYTGSVEIQQMAVSGDGRLLAFHDADRVRLLRLPSLQSVAVFSTELLHLQSLTSIQWFDDDRLLLLSTASGTLLVDVAGLAVRSLDLPLESLPETFAPVSNTHQLRALIERGQLDPARLAFPDPQQRPEGLQWELHDDKDGLEVYFSVAAAEAAQDPQDRGSLQLSLQPGSAALVSVGISRFQIHALRGGNRALIELVSVADHSLLFAHVLDDSLWGLDTLRFSEDGSQLLAKVSNFDGYIDSEYAFPVERPDLRVYLQPKPCQAPVNLPSGHWLRSAGLMDCPPQD